MRAKSDSVSLWSKNKGEGLADPFSRRNRVDPPDVIEQCAIVAIHGNMGARRKMRC